MNSWGRRESAFCGCLNTCLHILDHREIGHAISFQAPPFSLIFTTPTSLIIDPALLKKLGYHFSCLFNDVSTIDKRIHKPFKEIRRRVIPSSVEESLSFENSLGIIQLMLDKNVFHWTANILSHTRRGLCHKALSCFLQMRRNGLEPNEATISTTLTACANSMNLGFGLTLHSLILKLGFTRQLFVSSGLITVYSKYDRIDDARKLFDEMPVRDIVVWNSIISACSQKGLNEEAVELFSELLWNVRGFVNDFTLASVLKACAGGGFLRYGQLLHNYAIKMGFDCNNIYVGASLIDMYCKCERLDMALHVFERMETKDVVVWNSIINGSSLNGFDEEAIQLFHRMMSYNLSPSGYTLSCVLNASQITPDSTLGRYYHLKALKLGFITDVFVGTSLIDMYAKFLAIDSAERAFNEMIYKNVVPYNALISGYTLKGGSQYALRAYMRLRIDDIEPDPFTFAAILSCSASSRSVVDGTQIHSQLILFGWESDVFVANSLINFYSNSGLADSAMKAFETMRYKDIISWSIIISGLGEYSNGKMGLEMLSELHKQDGIIADEFCCSSGIKSAAIGSAIGPGKQLHAYVVKLGLEVHVVVGSALIDMYSKCGIVEDAHKLFCAMPVKNVISWNSMIMGYAQNGFAREALAVYEEMKKCNLLPTAVTFTGVLVACCNAGYVEEGKRLYKEMIDDYEIRGSIEHYTCMVNLLGRGGYGDEAETLILNSPFSEDAQIWRSLLGCCEAHSVGCRVAERCVELEPSSVYSTYTILSNMYAGKKMWSEVSRIRELMIDGVDGKEAGSSWIEARS